MCHPILTARSRAPMSRRICRATSGISTAPGLTLVGGRLDKLPDNRTVTFTFYKGANASLLCTRYKVSQFNPPPGAVHEMDDHLFYSYHGYSICYSYSPVGKFVCLLITRQPVKQLLDSVEYALE